MRIVVTVIAGVLVVALTLVLLVLMLLTTGLPLCADPPPGEVDACITSTAAERTIGIIAGWAGVVSGGLAVWLGIRWSIKATGGRWFALTALLAPALGYAYAVLVPVSF